MSGMTAGRLPGSQRRLFTFWILALLAGCQEDIREDVLNPGSGGDPVVGRQAEDLRTQLDNLAQNLAELQSRLERLEQADARSATPPTLNPSAALTGRVVDVSGLPSLGDAGARLAIVEVTDYQCPYCKAHYLETLGGLRERYIDNGQVQYFVLDYPLPGHDLAMQAALAAACADRRGKFWSFHDQLFERDSFRDTSEITAVADILGIRDEGFQDCLDDWRILAQLERRRSQALGLGVKGTPTFFIGRLDRNRLVSTVTMLAGRRTLADFTRVLDRYRPD